MVKVSVVIPTYNQAGLLRLALESVRAQTERDWEAVIINNHSEDETKAVVNLFADSRFWLIDFRNNGIIAASRNEGIRRARGEWIAFLDSDDLWEPGKLEVCLADSEAADLICHREKTVRNGRTLRVSPHCKVSDAGYRQLLFNGNCFSPTAVLVRRHILERVRGFREDPELVTCEDYDLWLRLAALAVRVRFIDSVQSIYRLHEGNSSAAVLRHMNAGLYAIEQHFRQLTPKRPLDGLRFRFRRSMVVYGAARQYADARRRFLESLRIFPLNPRALLFGTLSVLQPWKRDRSKMFG